MGIKAPDHRPAFQSAHRHTAGQGDAFIKRHRLDRQISSVVIDDLCKQAYCLRVDGRDSQITYEGPARYLDGDIWLAVEVEGRERFITTFLNVADPREREEELSRLFQNLEQLPESPRLIAQYDQPGEFISHAATQKNLLEEIFKFSLGS